jgi:hypothetical protein
VQSVGKHYVSTSPGAVDTGIWDWVFGVPVKLVEVSEPEEVSNEINIDT